MPADQNGPCAIAPTPDRWDHVLASHHTGVELAKAEGVYLYDTAGRRYFDASGGPMAVNLGHGDARVIQAVTEQMRRFSYCHPALANGPRADLCRDIAEVTPEGLDKVYLVSGGSEAVETAIKLARQYHLASGASGKHKIVSCYDSYHGMTLATQALSGSPGSAGPFEPMMPRWPHIQQYSDARRPEHLDRETWALVCARELEALIHYEGAASVAAFIATPHGSGADYGQVAPASYWREIRRICDEHDVLFIADEVVTGFGRTGRWFGMDHFGVVPDLMTFAKGLSACCLPLGAVAASARVAAPFETKTHFIHGFTHGGHAAACAAGSAVIRILRDDHLVDRSAAMGLRLFSHAERLLAHPTVAAVRGWGLFMVLELVDPVGGGFFDRGRGAERLFQRKGLDNGLALYSSLYGPRRTARFQRGLPMWISPPFVITEAEIDDLVDRLDRTLAEWGRALGAI